MRRRLLIEAVCGLLAAAAGLAAAEAFAAVLRPQAGPVVATGGLVIDLAPAWAKAAIIAGVGTADKAVIFATVILVVVIGAAVAGVLEARRPPFGAVLLVLLTLVAAIGALTRSGSSVADVAPAVVAAIVGVVVLRALDRRREGVDADRRRFLITAGVASAVAVAGGVVTAVTRGALGAAAASAARIRLPAPVVPVSAPAAADSFPIAGLAPIVTPNADFYRIDIDLAPVAVDVASWSLVIDGEVEHPVRLTYAELLALPLQESWTTLACVSNEVGGDLISNGRWLGYPVRALLAKAGVKAGADMVLSTGADGFTAGTPLSALTDARNAVLAVGLNGAVLPQEHGFPARLVVPGLYGYVSATKWITRMTVTRFGAVSPYWIQRGWSSLGPVKLSSRIDVPTGAATVRAGMVAVAGVAWSQHTGVSRVQLRIDDGPWRDAKLAGDLSVDSWRQWKYEWMAQAGRHTLTVRAVDAQGGVQTAKVADVVPNGATGLHSVQVTVA